ncbi:MAG: M23 family metallopeptidase [Candidatus Limnocylindria bacterium]
MTGRARRAVASLILQLAALGISCGMALGADDYTLPFYNPTVTMSYGVDRDRRLNHQLDWTGQVWNDGLTHYGRVYDQHTGIDYPMALRSEVAAAKDGTVVDVEGGFGTTQFGSFGNFVKLQHPDGRQTLYYHLASAADGGITVAVGANVLAGQRVGRSGCSGLCYGAHLHFEMQTWSPTTGSFKLTDPMAERRWTTWPGRIPFDAAYVRESNSGTEVIPHGWVITHWVEFRNTGGRAWRSYGNLGRTALGTWNPPAHASPFRAVAWPSSWVATFVDASTVSPDGIGRFSFNLYGAPPPGSYAETFNLQAYGLRWFDHGRLGGFYVPILVTATP